MSKVSIFWGQFINNSVTHNTTNEYPLRFCFQHQHASVVYGAFARFAAVLSYILSVAHQRELGILTGAGSWSSESCILLAAAALGIVYFTGASAQVIGYLKLSERCFLRVHDSLKRWNHGSNSQFGIGYPPEPPKPIKYFSWRKL